MMAELAKITTAFIADDLEDRLLQLPGKLVRGAGLAVAIPCTTPNKIRAGHSGQDRLLHNVRSTTVEDPFVRSGLSG